MSRTVIVEPFPSGHRFQWTQWVAEAALERGDEVTLLTSTGAGSSEQFDTFLAGLDITVEEPFTEEQPPTAEIARVLLAEHRARPIARYVVLDSDQLLKQWWRTCPRELRSRGGGPEGILMQSRFPPRLLWRDRHLLVLRLAKTFFALLALARGRASRVMFLVGREDQTPGGLLKKVRDPAVCASHSRDRAALRARYDLPTDRRLAGVLGSVSMRKNVPLVLDAIMRAADDVDLLLAGAVWDDVLEWLETITPEQDARIHRRIGFLSDEELDAYVAAVDLILVVQSNPGPSGIMGKALAAGVPVLSSASNARKREAADLGYGIHTDFDVASIAEGIRQLVDDRTWTAPSGVDLPTAADFGAAILGIRPNGAPGPTDLSRSAT